MRKSLRIGGSAGVAAVALLGVGGAGLASPGTAPHYRWTKFLPPAFTRQDVVLSAVRPLGAQNVWMFGQRYRHDQAWPVAFRWNGRGWHRAALPKGLNTAPTEIAGGRRDLWALAGRTGKKNDEDVLLHFDGRTWKAVRSFPQWHGGASGLRVLGDRSVQLVVPTETGTDVWRWDRRTWTRTASAAGTYTEGSTLPDGTVWAVGGPGDGALSHFDGHAWTAQGPAPALLGCADAGACGAIYTDALLSLSPENAVAAYRVYDGRTDEPRNLVVRWDGRAWTVLRTLGTASYSRLAPDGKGGFWAVRSPEATQRDVIVHEAADGRLTRYPYRPSHRYLTYFGAAATPSGSVIAFGLLDNTSLAWKLTPLG